MDNAFEVMARRLIDWFEVGHAPPFELGLLITNECHLKCLSCIARSRPSYNPDKELSDEKLVSIIKEAGTLGIKRCHLSGGGEATYRLDTALLMMSEIKKHGMLGSLVTNGTLFTEESIKKMVEIELDEVLFSIDGPDAETHDYLRGVEGTFNKAIKNVNLFDYWKKKLDKKKPELLFAPVI